jgi:hypothetical protein
MRLLAALVANVGYGRLWKAFHKAEHRTPTVAAVKVS